VQRRKNIQQSVDNVARLHGFGILVILHPVVLRRGRDERVVPGLHVLNVLVLAVEGFELVHVLGRDVDRLAGWHGVGVLDRVVLEPGKPGPGVLYLL